MYTIIGGIPFTNYTGTTTFVGLRVVGNTESFEEMESMVKNAYEDCSGLMLVLYNGKEIEYDSEGKMVKT
jgi:hypothetical protein